MNRRQVIAGLALPLLTGHARAQQPKKSWRIGWLAEGPDPGPERRMLGGFFDGLRDFGYVVGQNLTIEFRFAEGKVARLPQLAAELVGLKLDVIAAPGTRELIALQKATAAIPIVMLYPGDPIGAGLVTSLAHPGANITGTSLMYPDVGGKRLDFLREVVPKLRRVAILGNSSNASTAADMRATEAAATSQGLRAQVVSVESSERLDEGLKEIARDHPDGLLVLQDTLVITRRAQIAEFAQQNRIAAVFPGRAYVESGGLIGYGPNMAAVGVRAAAYVDKILKGAKPADLPVEQPSKFELLINLKTAKALGLDVPLHLQQRADEVIE